MGSKRRTHKRRTVFQMAATSLLGISAMGSSTLATTGDNQTDVNTNFDPKQQNEVISFIHDVDNLKKSQEGRILNELGREQRDAIAQVMVPKAAIGEKKEVSIHSSSTYDYNAAYQFNLFGVGGIKVFELHHEIMWNVADNEVSEADATGWTENLRPFWGDEGNVKSRLVPSDGSDSDVDSIRKRKLTFATGPWNTFTYYPETTLFADATPIRSGVAACDDDGIGGMENVDASLVCPSDYLD